MPEDVHADDGSGEIEEISKWTAVVLALFEKLSLEALATIFFVLHQRDGV